MFPLFCTSKFANKLHETKFKGMCILATLISELRSPYIKCKTSIDQTQLQPEH
jgi:hypothetical protein